MISLSSDSKKVIDESERFLARTTRDPSYFPVVIERGEGNWVVDMDGRRYLDFTSGIAVNNFGWPTHPKIMEVATRQMEKLAHAAGNDFYNIEQLELAKRLDSLLNGEWKSFLCNSGTEAVEAAIKVAKASSAGTRHYIISFTGAFHGRTAGSLALGGSKGVQKRFVSPLLPGIIHVPYPNPFRNPWRINGYEDPYGLTEVTIGYIEDYVLDHLVPSEEVAAVIAEPIQGEGGYVVPPKPFFRSLRKLTSTRGILLIDDEVQMGMGRTGKVLAIENFDTTPDVFTLAKSLGGGLVPAGATVMRSELDFPMRGVHSNTFGGNALVSAVASASIELAKELAPRVSKMGELFRDELPLVGADDVRGIGLAWGMEFAKNGKPDPRTRDSVIQVAMSKGLLLIPAGESAIRIIPPLTISEEEVIKGIEILKSSVAYVRSKPN